MAKTYPLKALWPLLPFEAAPAPLQATLDAYGGGLVKYAVNPEGIWLFSLAQPLNAVESENLTGFHPADLVPKQIEGVEGYFYALLGGAPLLPIPFTAEQLTEFNKRTAGLIGSCIERGSETDAWIADLQKDNPDAAELARGIHGGKWPVDLADIVDAKPDRDAKPRFRLADGILPSASARAATSAFDEVQRLQDQQRLLGIGPDMLKDLNRQSELEKLIGGSAGSMATAVYMDELKRNQDMLRVMNPSASDMAAEALGRQLLSTGAFATVGSDPNAYLQSQTIGQTALEKMLDGSTSAIGDALGHQAFQAYPETLAQAYRQAQHSHQTELEKVTSMIGGSMATALGQLDYAGLDAAMDRYHQPTASEMIEQIEQQRIEKANEDAERRLNIIEVPRIHFYDHQADEKRRLDREREHAIETARLAEIARLEARDEYEARKQSAPAPTAPVGVETQEARQKRRYDLCIAAGLQMPSDDYSHLPTGIGALARAENISTAAFSKDVKAYIASKR